jgi:hypothetical protein
MMGLLGEEIDPKTQGLLALGFGLLNSRGNLGQAIGQAGPQAMQAYSQANDAIQRKKQQEQAMQAQALQMQMSQQQIAEMQRQAALAEAQRAKDDEFRKLIPSPQGQAASAALAGGGGPTVGNAAAMPKVDPFNQQLFEAMRLGQIKPMDYLTATKKDNAPIKLAAGEGLYQPGTYRPLALNPKEDTTPSAIKEYNFAVQQGFKGSFQDFTLAQKRAGATNVSVSMDKGFGDAFAKDAAGSLATSRDQAKAAANTIGTLDRITSTLDSGKVALGPTAKFELFGRQLAESTGVGGKDNAEKLQNTRKMIQGAASLAVDGAAALKGQGQITEGERALVSRAAGGDVDSMTAPEIRALTGVLRKINMSRIEQHKAQLGNVGKQFAPFVPFYDVQAPEAPTSVDDLVKKYGSK